MKTLNAWLVGSMLALMLGSSYLLDGPDDHSTEWQVTQELLAAQKYEQTVLAREMAAAKFCRLEHGEAHVVWKESGDFVCVPRKPLYLARAK